MMKPSLYQSDPPLMYNKWLDAMWVWCKQDRALFQEHCGTSGIDYIDNGHKFIDTDLIQGLNNDHSHS